MIYNSPCPFASYIILSQVRKPNLVKRGRSLNESLVRVPFGWLPLPLPLHPSSSSSLCPLASAYELTVRWYQPNIKSTLITQNVFTSPGTKNIIPFRSFSEDDWSHHPLTSTFPTFLALWWKLACHQRENFVQKVASPNGSTIMPTIFRQTAAFWYASIRHLGHWRRAPRFSQKYTVLLIIRCVSLKLMKVRTVCAAWWPCPVVDWGTNVRMIQYIMEFTVGM